MKKTQAALLSSIVIGGALYVLAKNQPKVKQAVLQAIPQEVLETAGRLSRGLRNNNPGNIRIGKSAWLGKIDVSKNSDGAFEQFTDIAFGIRALFVLLANYQKSGANTIAAIISRYAPSSENNTSSYVSAVSRSLGVSPSEVITLTPLNVVKLAYAIIKHENGIGIKQSFISNVYEKFFK